MSLKQTTAVWRCAKQLTPRELLTLLALADFADDEGVCWPGVATLARMTGTSQRTIKYVLDSLRSPLRPGGPLLSVLNKGGGRGRPTIYRLHIPGGTGSLEPPGQSPAEPAEPAEPGGRLKRGPGRQQAETGEQPAEEVPRDSHPPAGQGMKSGWPSLPQMENQVHHFRSKEIQSGAEKGGMHWTERLRASLYARKGESGDQKGAAFREKSAIVDGKGASSDEKGATLDGKGATLTHEMPTSVINRKENHKESSKDPSRQGARSPIPFPKKVNYDPNDFQPCAYPGCLIMTATTYCGLHAKGRLTRPRPPTVPQPGQRPDATVIPNYPRKPR